MYDSRDIDQLRTSLTASEVRSRIRAEGADAWREVSRFLADDRRDWVDRASIAEVFIDLYCDSMVESMIQAAEMNPTIAEYIAYAHLGDMSGAGVERLSNWQDTYQHAREEQRDTESKEA